MMKSLKRLAALCLVAVQLIGITSVAATEVGADISEDLLNQDGACFSVSLAAVLSANMDENGVVTTATNNTITNNSSNPVVVESAVVEGKNSWNLVPWDTDFSKSMVDAKDFSFRLNGNSPGADGSISAGIGVINGCSEVTFTYDAKVAPRRAAENHTEIAQAIFVIGWHEPDMPVDPEAPPEAEEPVYVMATDADFSGETDGLFAYVGTDDYVEIPQAIKGVSVTNYASMFADTSVSGVKSTNENVTNMNSMFAFSKATTLDLSDFDTSSVKNMNGMFRSSAVATLDLSSFDTSSVKNLNNIFRDSAATIGYARTQSDADIFNASSEKPATLNFKIK